MTPAARARLAELAEKATPGPWRNPNASDEVVGPDRMVVAITSDHAAIGDSAFIAAARSAVPDLLSALAAAEREVERLCQLVTTYEATASHAASFMRERDDLRHDLATERARAEEAREALVDLREEVLALRAFESRMRSIMNGGVPLGSTRDVLADIESVRLGAVRRAALRKVDGES